MSTFRVPDSIKTGLEVIRDLSAADADRLGEALKQARPGEYPPALSRQLQGSAPFEDESRVDAIAEALLFASGICMQPGLDFRSAVEDLLVSGGIVELPEAVGALVERLQRLLSIPVVRLTAKSTELMSSVDRPFFGARIVSDIRPLFLEAVDHDPEGAAIVHVLRIEYGDSGMGKSIAFTLDDSDLGLLLEVVQRAIGKDATLRNVAKRAGMAPVISVSAESH